VLLWGRENRDPLTRICKWSVDLGYKGPTGMFDLATTDPRTEPNPN
jgi:hypothetical protein